MTRAFLIAGLWLGVERVAPACPFCGGKGASGLAGNLLLAAGLWFVVRAFMRAMQRRQLRERPPAAPDE